uniref:Uncharacterized protein n=1 Tax=Oryzias latipes TaxID=8090 RepID=A0A3P9M2T2_ORYLA
MCTHSPLPHWNSPTGQRGFWGSFPRLQRSADSSDLSLQSGSPSQLHRAGMHSELLQRNSCWPHVGEEHFSSSLESPQSLSPSGHDELNLVWVLCFCPTMWSQGGLILGLPVPVPSPALSQGCVRKGVRRKTVNQTTCENQ